MIRLIMGVKIIFTWHWEGKERGSLELMERFLGSKDRLLLREMMTIKVILHQEGHPNNGCLKVSNHRRKKKLKLITHQNQETTRVHLRGSTCKETPEMKIVLRQEAEKGKTGQ